MIYLHFIRHGETIFNTYHRMQGWCDTPLTDKGIQQAMEAGIALKDMHITHVYTSDSGRAYETARMIAGMHGQKPCAMAGFREMFFGTMEGLDTQMGRFNERDYRDACGWVDVGGENMEQLENRMFKAISQILPVEPAVFDEHIVIVSHGIAIMSVVHRLDPVFFEELDDYGGVLENVSMTTITYENGSFKLQDFNNTDYKKTKEDVINEENYQ